MANFSYGVSRDYGFFGHEDDVLQRSSDEDLDDMVQRNIRDVLQQAGVDEESVYEELLEPQEQRGESNRGTQERSRLQQPDGDMLPGGSSSSSLQLGSASGAVGLRTQPSKPLQQPGNRRPGAEGQERASLAGGTGGSKSRSAEPGTGAGPGPGSAARRSGTDVANGSTAGVAGVGSLSALLDVPGQPEASLRLHKARIKALEDDLGRANKLLSDREKQLGEALRELKELRSQAASWARDKKALEGQVDRTKKQATEAEAALRNTESQVRELAKVDSRAERERRASEAEVRARDVRLQRALEEVERYKQLLSEVRVQEREAKGSAQQDTGRLLAENRKLERQRAELITAFKKQLKLIEVLKRQKVHLEAARALQFSEEEFFKTLEMGAA